MINIDKIEVDVGYSSHITNCYLVYDENGEGIIIDPGYEEDKIINEIKTRNCNIKYIIMTHSHADHMGALLEVQKFTNAKILVHIKDLEALLEKEENYTSMFNIKNQNIDEELVSIVKDSDVVKVGNLKFEIIHTPGHTAGSICILEVNNYKLFTGDTLFCDSYGRCDLYSGDFSSMVNSLRKVFGRFDNITIYPGHGEISELIKAKRYIKMLMVMKKVKL